MALNFIHINIVSKLSLINSFQVHCAGNNALTVLGTIILIFYEKSSNDNNNNNNNNDNNNQTFSKTELIFRYTPSIFTTLIACHKYKIKPK